MLKRDYHKEIVNSLKIVNDIIDEAVLSMDKKKASIIIEEQLKGLVGLNIETITTLSFDSIRDIITRENELNFEKYIALGELLRLQGKLDISFNDIADGVFYYCKSLKAFNEAMDLEGELEEDIINSIKIVNEYLSNYELNYEDSITLFKSYYILGKYDKAEDNLYEIIKNNKDNNNIIEIGIGFYNKLKELSDEDLIRGNFSRDEIDEGINEINKYTSKIS